MTILANKETSEKLSESLTTVQGMGSLSGQGFPIKTTVKCGAKLRSSRLADSLCSSEGTKQNIGIQALLGLLHTGVLVTKIQSPYRGKLLSLGAFWTNVITHARGLWVGLFRSFLVPVMVFTAEYIIL